jgi:phage FluMu protein Com
MIFTIKCHQCGKFIADKDIKSGDAESKCIWSTVRMELDDVIHFCVKCTKELNKEDEK